MTKIRAPRGPRLGGRPGARPGRQSTGTEEHHLVLSKDRAQSVSFYMATLEVQSSRFSAAGYGEAQPIALNDTPEGRQKNRRVDIAVMANEKLKKAALEKTRG